jgi:hypothetical protein
VSLKFFPTNSVLSTCSLTTETLKCRLASSVGEMKTAIASAPRQFVGLWSDFVHILAIFYIILRQYEAAKRAEVK